MEFNIIEENKELGGIYTIYSKTNKRTYFGSTKNFKKRYKRHLSAIRNEYCNILFSRHIKKYGLEDLVFEIKEIIPNYTKEKGKQVEQLYLNDLFSSKEAKRFNILPEAYGTHGFKVKQRTRTKLSKSKIGKKGRPTTENEKILISRNLGGEYIQKDLSGNEIARYMSPYEASIATGLPLKKIKKSANCGKTCGDFMWQRAHTPKFPKIIYKFICQYSEEGNLIRIFDSIESACKEIKADQSTVMVHCKQESKRKSYGFFWRRFIDASSIIKKLDNSEINKPKKIHKNSKEVLQIDIKSGKVINKFLSPRDASNKTGVPYSNIRRACNFKKYKNACGFRWEYVL